MARYVLSIDGGGIRGIVSARILCEVERRLKKPVCELFDLVVGSSVGSIIASALTIKDAYGNAKYTSKDVLEILVTLGPKIFKCSLMRKAFSIVYGSKFSSSYLEKVLVDFFADMKIGDIPVNIMVPSYDLRTQRTCMLRSWEDGFKEIKCVDALLAASAAPTIFPPRKIVIQHEKYLMIDSAIIANNPSVCGYSAADTLYPGEDVYFLSIGSGEKPIEMNCEWDSMIFWAANIVPIFFDAGMEAVDYQMARIVGRDKYVRITGTLNKANQDFTDVSHRNIAALQEDADMIVEKNSSRIDQFVALAHQRCTHDYL